MFLLDTDIVIYHLNGQAQTQSFVLRLMSAPVFMSSVTYMETEEGIPSSSYATAITEIWQELLESIVLLPFDEAEAYRAAGIRRSLRAQGLSVRARTLDIMIAPTALEHGLTLATNNAADYRDIPDLLIETP
ncbi:type II toxin-antitoxin system VapC family toxin [soil metagenome]